MGSTVQGYNSRAGRLIVQDQNGTHFVEHVEPTGLPVGGALAVLVANRAVTQQNIFEPARTFKKKRVRRELVAGKLVAIVQNYTPYN